MTITETHQPPQPPPPPPPAHSEAERPPYLPPPRGWPASRIVAIVLASLMAVTGLGLVTAGGALGWATATQRDRAGYFHTPAEPLHSNGFAITTDVLDFGDNAWPFAADGPGKLFDVRLRATSADASRPVFIGIARASDVRPFLEGVAHDVIVDLRDDPFQAEYEGVTGERTPARPQDQTFWDVSSAGTGQQSVVWQPRSGDWVVVIMNGDSHADVTVKADAGVAVRDLSWIIGGLFVSGFIALIGGVVLIIVITRRSRTQARAVTPF